MAVKQKIEISNPSTPRISNRHASTFKSMGWQALIVGIVVALWQIAVWQHWIDGFLTGSPVLIWQSARSMWSSGSLLTDIEITAIETLSGFTLGTVGGAVIGYSFWYWTGTSKVFQPFAVVFNGVPKIALAPLIIIWFGTGIQSKILLAFASTVVVALLAAYQGAMELDRDFERLLWAFGATRRQVFLHLILPGSMPWVVNAMRINVGLALVGAVIGEFIASQAGLGHAVFVAGNLFELNVVWVGVLTLSLMALILYGGVAVVERLVIRGRPW